MNTVLTIHNLPYEWYQDTYICCECNLEFMTNDDKAPRFCPRCGARFDAMRIKYRQDEGARMETVFLRDPEEDIKDEGDANSKSDI